MTELKLRAKIRDNFRCQRCRATENLHVHHTKGAKSHRLSNLETLCQRCHHAEHGFAGNNHSNGKRSAVKAARSVWGEGR